MTKKRKIIALIIFGLFLCSTVGCIISYNTKPNLYYPELTLSDGDAYEFFTKDFNTIGAIRLYLDGDCSAGYGDFVAMHISYSYEIDPKTSYSKTIDDENYLVSLAEKMAAQGAKALVYKYNPGMDSILYSGTLYVKTGNEIEQFRLFEKTSAQFSKRLNQYADRPLAVPLCISSFISFAAMVLYVLLSQKRDKRTAIEILSKRKYRVSVLAAGFMFVVTLAWLTAPNIHMLTQNYFEKGVFIASLVSLPFLAGSIIALLNLTVFQKYKRWINIVCLAVAGCAFAILLLSVVMMQFT